MEICVDICIENFINTTIADVEIFISPHASKSLNSFEKIQMMMFCATFNDNLCTAIVSCYCSIHASDEIGVNTFYNVLSFLSQHIPKQKVLNIGESCGHIPIEIILTHGNIYLY